MSESIHEPQPKELWAAGFGPHIEITFDQQPGNTSGAASIYINKILAYTFHFATIGDALIDARQKLRQLLNLPWAWTKQGVQEGLIGRLIYYCGDPAVAMWLNGETGCVLIQARTPSGVFTPVPYECDPERAPQKEFHKKIDLLDPHIHWWGPVE